MRIVHIAPNSPYNDYWGYQDNLLPKYQRKLGHEVTVIITNTMHQNGKIVETDCADYVLNDGVRVIRRPYKQYFHPTITGILTHMDIYSLLENLKPDFIFYHGLVSYTIFDVVKYLKRHPACKAVEDNHMDYNIGNKFDTPKEKVIRAWLRYINKKSIKYISKVYGVTPWRKTYAEDYFGIPSSKTDVLIMGADDEKMHLEQRQYIRKQIRMKYNILEKDFLIVTGGKIDKKKKIDILMRACAEMPAVKLLIFGSVADDVKKEFDILNKNDNIIYIGWIDSDKVYEYFYAADLAFFPGQHSVLWEQACASKVPCVFEKWEGMDHVNNGGNSDFVSPVDVDNIKKKIQELNYTEKYYLMKKTAESSNTEIYLYSHIAEKSLECAK
jgi:glycosyltransferase involved in cell wall biosynthesis